MKCLTVRQPWAWAILQAGKGIENRTWPTRHRGPLLIHAGTSRGEKDLRQLRDWARTYGVKEPAPDALVFGAILGVVDLVACLPRHQVPADHPGSNWAEGPWCWLLANPRPLDRPVPWKGLLGLFEVPEAIGFTPETVR